MAALELLETRSRRMTIDEWMALDEDEPGEIVDDVLVEEEMPSNLHEVVAAFLLGLFRAWTVPRGGLAFGSQLKLVVRPQRGRKADACAYLPGQKLPGRHRRATTRAPAIVVEVLSPRPRDVRRDTIDKLAEYATFGVRYYWLVDPLARTLEILELRQDAPPQILVAAAEGSHPVPGCDGLVVDLTAMWSEIDRLPDDDEDEDEPA